MTINILSNSLKNKMNGANPNTLADQFRDVSLGSVLLGPPTYLRKQNAVTSPVNPYILATLRALALPDDAKAHSIIRATARAGTAAAGELTVVGFGVTPATTQIAVAPTGDIVLLAADAYTDVDVVYLPEASLFVREYTLPVVANVATLPPDATAPQSDTNGVVLLQEAEALVGTTVGNKIILVPGAAAPAATQARLNLAKTTVTFAGADAVTSCRVKVGLAQLSAKSLQTKLVSLAQIA